MEGCEGMRKVWLGALLIVIIVGIFILLRPLLILKKTLSRTGMKSGR